MRSFLRATLLFLPLMAFWHFAGAPWDAWSALAVGALMLLGTALRRPWTAWVSARDWQGMDSDPLFLQINQLISALWGLVLIVSGSAWALGGGSVWRWAPSLLGGVLSAVLPLLLVRWQLGRRLQQADPHPWPSPLLPGRSAAVAVQSDAPLDVAVVGAGIGGLTAAALLARAGARVAVFEQHDKPGGFCHCWEGVVLPAEGPRQVFRFDGGVHDVSGYFDGGTVKNLLQRLDLDELLAWQRLDHAYILDGQRWDVPRGWDAFTAALAQRFPGDAAGLRALLADVRQIFDAMYSTAVERGGVPGTPGSVQALMNFARSQPLAVRWMSQPFEALLEHHHLSAAARAQIKSLSGYVTHEPGQRSVAAQVPLLGYFLHGGHYPVGGSGALAQALADSLALDGGQLHLGCAVQSVQLAPGGQGVQGLQLADGRRLAARSVVLAGDAIAALRLLQPAKAVPAALRTQLQSLRPATSMFSVHLGVRGTPPALPAIVHLQRRGEPGVELVLPCAADPSAAPAGHYTLELMRLVPPAQAASWFTDPEATDPRAQRDSAEYQQRKAQEADAMIDLAESLIPGLRQDIVFRREASPLTFRRYGYSSCGAIYGVTDAQKRIAPLRRRSPVPGLVFAGSATTGAGVEPAMISGAEAADALIPGLLAQGARLPQ